MEKAENSRLNAIIKFIKDNIILLAAIIAVGGIVLALNILFPYSGDDWYWATRDFSWSEIVKLNGRYLGTILSLIITKVRPLRVIICLVITLAMIYVLSLSGDGHRGLYFIVGAAFLAALPSVVMSETIVWASGFANYVPSALMALAYIIMVKGEFSDTPPEYSKKTPYLSAALGFFGALFMETITIGNIVVGAAVLIYHFIRFKKPSITLIAFLGGAIVGAVLMFVNPVYFGIAEGDDPENYRTINFAAMLSVYFNGYHYYLTYENCFLNLFTVGMLVWMFVRNFSVIKAPIKVVIICCFFVQAIYLLLSSTALFEIIIPTLSSYVYYGVIKGAFTFLYCMALVAEVVLIPKDLNLKLTCLFAAGAILAYTLPLLAVNPIGGRNFLVSYLIFSFVALRLLSENLKGTEKNEKKLVIAFVAVVAAVVLVVGALDINIYARIRSEYNEREESVTEQIAAGAEEITVSPIFSGEVVGNTEVEYVHNANPDNEYLAEYFKKYYGIDESVKITVAGVGSFG